MSSPRRRHRSPAVKTPLEDDDLLGEILVRLPPQLSSLPRAALVCKRWRCLASDPGFFRRFRRHHRRSPPLLGFFKGDVNLSFTPTLDAPNQVPPGRFSLQRGDGDLYFILGCRHGLVLIFKMTLRQMLVWDPVTGDQHLFAIPRGIATISGTVLRVGDAHFQVVLTGADNEDKQHRRAVACIYSSETGLWGDLISTPVPSMVYTGINFDDPILVYTDKPAVLAGNSIYWMLTGKFVGILEFDLEKQSLAVIRVPVHMLQQGQFWIVRAEDGGLGLLFLTGNILQLWKRKTDCDGVASWALGRTIELNKILPIEFRERNATILGFAEENNVIFLWTYGVLFMVHLQTLQLKKLFEIYNVYYCHPFESVYSADVGSHSGG